ncbi:S41 family peptidase [Bowmanella yangjiangensis]|uniref:Tricorn protease homolog n=1 Tax=Bowmanella yangjiangensis TaxID=2811230 RepID=A0ABS3CVZ5_9ALTE|nr:S41 family peptidase [Bowmanella yangjiangensis]MBN7820321.1 PDZ domain-containing protein [Bowmanella yangjiangensis]
MKKTTLALLLGSLSTLAAAPALAGTKMLQSPTISDSHIAFVYAGDIYRTDKKGQNVTRLTSHAAEENQPHFSPDGKWLAYTGAYDNNQDVYIIPTQGGQPQRLTWHAGRDEVVGWSEDGKAVLFTSYRETANGRTGQLYQVSIEGGLPEQIMRATVADADLSADGRYLAYNPHQPAHRGGSGWRNHRGGTTPPVWIYDLKRHSYEEVPHGNFSDTNPMWVGDKVYFLSDRNKSRQLFAFNKGKLNQVTDNTQWDITSADAHGDEVVYAQGGELYVLDSKKGRSTKLDISLNVDLPQWRAEWKDAMPSMTNAVLSATGKRVLISARGEIFSVPVEDGASKNLTTSSGKNERDGLWSPSGEELVYITDEKGQYQIVVADQFGQEKRRFAATDKPADVYLRHISGDGKHLVFSDSRQKLWLMALDSGKKTEVMEDIAMLGFDSAVSNDGRLLAYTKRNTNYLADLYVYEIETGKHHKITDGMSNSALPAFSPDGQYLYFASSTNSGPTAFFLDMSTQEKPQRFGLYAVVLDKQGKSPLLPRLADEEAKSDDSDKDKDAKDNKDKKDDKDKASKAADLDGVTQRVVALPVDKRFYTKLAVGSDNNLYFVEHSQAGAAVEASGNPERDADLKRFNLEKREVQDVEKQVFDISTSADGKVLLLTGKGNKLSTAKVGDSIKATPLKTDGVQALIDPRQEWAQIFAEAWRNERDYFYDANMHGLNWQKVYEQFLPLLKDVGRREDLNWLIREMIAQMEVGHNVVYGGDGHKEKPVKVGMLGADFSIEKGQYKIAGIFTGERWNPELHAPLAVPGIDIQEGDTLHAIDGQPLSGKDNIYRLLTGKANTQVRLLVSRSGKEQDAKTVVVETLDDDRKLRHWHWVEQNRQYVWEKTNGKAGYVYLPNTAGAGYTNFNRMFYAQADKPAMVIDERSNGGGQAANYITDVLSRQYLAGWKYRSGSMVLSTPATAVYGPKVMLIDQDAGSGGDFLPYSFKRMELGKLIGKTTWGGLIGVSANRNFVDGGRLNVPHFRFFTPEHEWRVENEGVAPDIDVELDPVAVNRGEDPQLQRAIAEVLKDLESYKPVRFDQAPAMPKEVGK